jgi:hypothetical protein
MHVWLQKALLCECVGFSRGGNGLLLGDFMTVVSMSVVPGTSMSSNPNTWPSQRAPIPLHHQDPSHLPTHSDLHVSLAAS